jgi:hypothetical protein
VEGGLYEQLPKRRLLRGWFRLTADGGHHVLDLPGRYVALDLESFPSNIGVYVRGPSWSTGYRHPLLASYWRSNSARIWIPSDAQGLVIYGHTEELRIELPLSPATTSLHPKLPPR